MTKRKKTPDTNTVSFQSAKNGTPSLPIEPLDDYSAWDIEGTVSEHRPRSVEALKQFMKNALIEIKRDENMMTLEDYLGKVGIYASTYYRWKDKFPWMKDIHQEIHTLLWPRYRKWVDKNHQRIHFISPIYDPRVSGEAARFWAELKKTEAPPPTQINVYKTKLSDE